jgi:hypothetical protein
MHANPSQAEEETAMTRQASTQPMQELDYRESNGIAVSLLWQRSSNRLTVVVEDSQLGDRFMLPARPGNAREVFHHPYAYAQPLDA